MNSLNNNETSENKKSIKEFLLIAIPVGAFLIIAVTALVIGIVITEKRKNRDISLGLLFSNYNTSSKHLLDEKRKI